MQFRKILLILIFIAPVGSVYSQTNNALKSKVFPLLSDTLVLDSLSIVPGSLQIENDSLYNYSVDYKRHALIFKKDTLRPSSIRVKYKTFPYNFEKKYFHKNADEFLFTDLSRPPNPYTITFNEPVNTNDLFLNDGLNKNGSISRGITFGNNQDVVVNSNLNLQVSGKLTPEIDMVMAATDNNIPFQADGTTAQLQEFDKVFIQLSNENTKLIVGDYQLSKPTNSYFMNYYKRAQEPMWLMLIKTASEKDQSRLRHNWQAQCLKVNLHVM